MLVEKLKENLSDFEESIDVIETEDSQSVRYLSKDDNSYKFNQLERLNDIDRYYNSVYKDGKKDSEGQRKLYLNRVKFVADVSQKETDVDVKDYIFIPDTQRDVDATWFIKRMFKTWTRQNGWGKMINDLNKDYSKYGTCVAKRVGKLIERVPLKTLKNTQDADSLEDAVERGGYVIQEHQMTPRQMLQMPDWEVPDLEEKKYTVYEMYQYCPESATDKENGGEDNVLTLSYILKEQDEVLFSEQVDKLPYEEAHWDKIDGRWLGVGVVEDNIENQIATNMTANLQHRAMLWGSKKVFQSADTDMVGKNLVKEVADGEILEVGQQGAIQQVDMQTQHAVDFNQSDATWNENLRQKSFVFEINSGETMPSGTPFRLGVLLSNAAKTHFMLKRENFGFFLDRSFFNQMMPIFRKELSSKDQVLTVASNEEGIERYHRALLNQKAWERLKKKIIDKNLVRNLQTLEFNWEQEFQTAREELKDEPYLFLKARKDILKNAHFTFELSITGEEIDTPKQIETLSTLIQLLPPEDERRERMLNRVVSLTGMDATSVLGKLQSPQELQLAQQNAGTTNTGTTQGLSELVEQRTRERAEEVPSLAAQGGGQSS